MKTLYTYNPNNLPVEELPYIIGFNNGGPEHLRSAVSIAQDGTVLGTHVCTHEGWMISDLGLSAETLKEHRTEAYIEHYPNGYRTTFITYNEAHHCAPLKEALALNAKNNPEAKGPQAKVTITYAE
jgi:hypothetical protein